MSAASDEVPSSKRTLADDAVTAAKLADDAVVTAAIADDAITSALIADDAVVQAAIADDAVDEARLQISNAGSNGQFLSKQSGNTGGLTWAEVSSGTTWDSTIKTADFTAVAGNGYLINTTSSTFTVTFPSSATVGDLIELIDVAGTADTNAIKLSPNGLKFNGSTTEKALHDERVAASFVYTGATYGWMVSSSTEAPAPTLINAPYSVAALIIAGGGGGGKGGGTTSSQKTGGGGGAGGVQEATSTLIPPTQYTVTVGTGGAGGTSTRGSSGGNSSFNSTTSNGGGGGGGNNTTTGLDGGSGGGSPHNQNYAIYGDGISGQGHDGGWGDANFEIGGGGGGKGEAGSTDQAGYGGDGSNTWATWATATSTGDSGYYGGGGGAGCRQYYGQRGLGGDGGGGAGTQNTNVCVAGTANTGGGGGGGGKGTGTNGDGAAGGSGLVIIRYAGVQRGTGGTVVTTGGYTYHTFTSSGTYTS